MSRNCRAIMQVPNLNSPTTGTALRAPRARHDSTTQHSSLTMYHAPRTTCHAPCGMHYAPRIISKGCRTLAVFCRIPAEFFLRGQIGLNFCRAISLPTNRVEA